MTSYVLRLYDDPLLRFDASYGEGLLAGKIEAHVRWFDESKRALLPFPLAPEPDNAKLTTWLERRTIPKNREFATQVLAQAGLSIADTLGNPVRTDRGFPAECCTVLPQRNFWRI